MGAGAVAVQETVGPLMSAVAPIALTVGGFGLGLLTQHLLFGRLPRRHLLVAVLRGPVALWGAILGLYVASEFVDVSPRSALLIRQSLLVLVILSASWALARLAGAYAAHASRDVSRSLPAITLLVNVARLTVLCVGVLVILQTLGISITPLLTALGIGGLAVGLALQDTLANFFAGIHILSSRQVRPGDFVRVESGEEGYVADITWRYTTIRQLANNVTIVPNAKLASAVVTNYYLPDTELAVLVPLGVRYGSDLGRVEAVTIAVAREVMREVPGGVPGFEPFIRFSAFAESSVAFTVILRGREVSDQHLIRHEFIRRLHERYRTEGIEVPFPTRTVHLHPAPDGRTDLA